MNDLQTELRTTLAVLDERAKGLLFHPEFKWPGLAAEVVGEISALDSSPDISPESVSTIRDKVYHLERSYQESF